jgi:hypothetical protein
MREKEYICKSALHATYGLTPKMIEELGEPDKVGGSPHSRRAPLAKLYLIPRVEAWVNSNRERVDRAKETRARRLAAKAAHEAALERFQGLRDAGDVVGLARLLYEEYRNDPVSRCAAFTNVILGQEPRFRLTPAEVRAYEKVWKEGRLAFLRSLGDNRHKQSYIAWKDKEADVDEEIAPLILAIWQAGFDTTNSCQETPMDGRVWIQFDALHGAKTFLNLVGRGHLMKDDRIEGYEGNWHQGWEYRIECCPLRELQVPEGVPIWLRFERDGLWFQKPNPACFEFYKCSVRFPRADLPATLERLRTSIQGRVPPDELPAANALARSGHR